MKIQTTRLAQQRRAGRQTLKSALQRLTMTLILVMLTSMSAWATDITVTYKISVSGTIPQATITNAETGATVCTWDNGIHTLWPANETHVLNDQYQIKLTPNRDLDKTGKNENNENASTTAFKTEQTTIFTVDVLNSQYYLKSVTFKEDNTVKASLEVAPNNNSGDVTIIGQKFFNYITVELTTDTYYRLTPSGALSITTTPARTYNNAKYYTAGTDITITPTNASCIVESVSGVNNATIAADKRSFSFAMPAGNISPSASLAEVHTISGVPNDVSISAPYTTISNTKYYLKNQTYTLTAPTDKAFGSFTATGAASSSVATDKKSATITIGTADVTVSATLLTIGGTCGENATWRMSDENNDGTFETLNIEGTGNMANYAESILTGTIAPWRTDFNKTITTVNIADGITSIGNACFASLNFLTEITLPSSVSSIGGLAFNNCLSLTRINIQKTDGVVSLGNDTFYNCNALSAIVVPTPALALQYATADKWTTLASKLRTEFGGQLFAATNEGGTVAYKIATADDLHHLAAAVDAAANISSGKTFRQTADIDLTSGGNFTPIGYSTGPWSFEGTYDGGSHTISGLTVSGDYMNAGLFACVSYGTVKDVILVSPTVTSTDNISNSIAVGALAGYCAYATIENCHAVNPTVSATGSGEKVLGALIGDLNSGPSATNCYFYGGNQSNAQGSGSGTLTNVSAAHLVTPATGVTIQTEMAANLGFSCDSDDDGTPENYWREGAELTLGNTLGEAPEGYTLSYTATAGTVSGSTLTVGDDDATVSAQWSPITYTIDYDLDGGSVDPANPTSFTIETPTFTLNNPTKPGYTFTGWTGTGLTGITTTVVIEQGSTTHRTYTANYEFAQITEGDLTFVCTSGTEAKLTACNQSATSVTIPTTVSNNDGTYTVTAIEATAFSGCTSLNTLILKATTPPALGSDAFSACTALNTIYVPSDAVDTYKTADNWKDYADKIQGYDTCGDNVYYSYDSTSKTLHLFGTGAMADYNNSTNRPWHSYRGDITTVVIDDGVTSIGQKAFSGCTGLTSIEIPDNVTSIGEYAFEYCTNLKTVFIGNGVTSIGGCAFWECNSLKTVIVSRTSSAPSLGNIPFPYNANLKIYIPVNITSQVHTQYTKDNWYSYSSSHMLVDSWMSGTCATTLKNGVLTVVGFALAGYAGPNSRGDITSVVIDESVTSISGNAFSGCDNLATITVDANNQTFDSRDNCNAIIRKSNNELVAGCKNTTIPNSVTSIGDHAFESCGLTTISIPASVTSIGASAFQGNGNLTSITIPASVTSIGWSAFYQCGLTTITIPDGVQSIGESAFSTCYNLESVHIGSGLTSIDGSVFGNCDKLATITVDANNQTFDSRGGCNAIILTNEDKLVVGCKTTVIPNSVTSIGEQAFNDHDGLTAITIPASVTSIGVAAFHSCGGLNTVTIGSGVTSIGNSAFNSCDNLESVTIYATSAPTLVGSVFASNKSGRKIYVFSDRVDAYKSAWGLYASAIEDIPALAVHDAGGEMGSWCTYYNGLADATVADGTTVYTAKRNNEGGVTLTATGSRIIKRGEAVLLKSAANVVLSSAASSGDGVYTDNELQGVDVETPQDANTTYYVLSKPAGKDFGFYKLARENGNSEPIKLGANKAYLAVASAHDAPEFIGFGENTTAINEHEFNESHELSGAIYDLQGRKIANGQKPSQRHTLKERTAKGLYIVNGKKVIIK